MNVLRAPVALATAWFVSAVSLSATTYNMTSLAGWNLQSNNVYNSSGALVTPRPYDYASVTLGGDPGQRMRAMWNQAYFENAAATTQMRPRSEVDRVLFTYSGTTQLATRGEGVLSMDYIIPANVVGVPFNLRTNPAVANYPNTPNIIGQIMLWNTPDKVNNNYNPIVFLLYRSDGIYLEHLWDWNQTNGWQKRSVRIRAGTFNNGGRFQVQVRAKMTIGAINGSNSGGTGYLQAAVQLPGETTLTWQGWTNITVVDSDPFTSSAFSTVREVRMKFGTYLGSTSSNHYSEVNLMNVWESGLWDSY